MIDKLAILSDDGLDKDIPYCLNPVIDLFKL